jgi:hypothetical protein
MVVRLCEALDIPLRARNELLSSAGYAALYPERSLDILEMAGIRDALSRIASHHEPYPAFVVDREWRVVLSNGSATRLVSACLDEVMLRSLSPNGALNFMRMMFEPLQMRPRIRNWASVAPRLLARLRNEARGDPRSPSAALLRELGPQAEADISSEEPDPVEASDRSAGARCRRRDLATVQHHHDVRHPERMSACRNCGSKCPTQWILQPEPSWRKP